MKMKILMMIGILIMILNGINFAHNTGRQCNNPYDMMCNANHLCQGHGICIPNVTYAEYSRIHNEIHQPKPNFYPTPQNVVEIMLEQVHLTKDDLLYDVGCGDGRIIKTAAQKYGCKALGIEIKPELASAARKNIQNTPGTRIQLADATKLNLSRATVVTFYLDQETMDKILPKLTNATRIVSHYHVIKRKGTKKILVGNNIIYIWDIYRGGVR